MLYIEEVWPVWAVTVGVALPLVAVLLACVCCRKTVPKTELMGLAGMVKITNPEDNNSNHNNQNSDACTVLPCAIDTSANNTNKRASTTANRSLPDIPRDSERSRVESGDTLWESTEQNDTSSELYATVEENKHITQPLVSASRTDVPSMNKKRLTHEESKSSEHSSLSQTDDSFSPYARLKEHPYDKLKDVGRTASGEHPYAQVGATSSELGSAIYDLSSQSYTNQRTSIQSEDLQLPQPSTSTDTSGSNPIPPPRTRKSSSHNSLNLSPASESAPDIQAATAIAGRISANQELPYMTPPIQQTNFSGDSQDSKGYTSISVREPLANIKAQTKVANQRSRAQELVDSHYATVSDDSDEMYAAIEEPGQVYTSGSETYAQIFQQTAAAAAGDGTHYPPQPPSVDSLKQVAQVHSRQASSSSATSSVANLGSPKPEKRQANSPLPPPPAAGSPELYAAVDKASVSRNLEEMYAKVMKKKQREASEGSSSQGSPTQPEVDTMSASGSDPEFVPPPEVVEPSYESLGGPSSIDPGYEVVQRNTSDCDPNYEELRPQSCEAAGRTDPGYEQVGATALPNYEELRPHTRDLGDCGIIGIDGLEEIDPSYEQVKKFRETQSSREENIKIETEFPGYEQVGAAALEVGYAKVNKNRGNVAQESVDIWVNLGGYEHVRAQNKDNPNKESKQEQCNGDRPSSSDGDTYSAPEPDYASVSRDNPEPNYESMSSDANYETVSYFDPPYERLHNETRDSDDTSNYEKVSNTQWDAINGNTNLCKM